MTRVTVLGTGAMGTRMARRLIDAGRAVTVWNRTPAATAPLVLAGAKTVATPRAVEIIGQMPTASPAAKGAAAGMLAGNFAPQFSVALARQDFGYADALAVDPAQAPVLAADNLTGIVRLYG